MFALALRDYQREQYAPTRRTRPKLHKRRYSIDVNSGKEKFRCEWARENCDSKLEPSRITQELELVSPSTRVRGFLNPVRHVNHYKFLPRPPDDNGTFLGCNISLSNADWKRISHYSGDYAFMQDDALDMALKVLAHKLGAPTHGIAISTSFDSQICIDTINDQDSKQDFSARFGHCNWIFMPLNNGILQATEFMESFKEEAKSKREDGEARAQEILGSHWALVAVDRIHKVIHYIDGWQKGNPNWRHLAHSVASNMLHTIGEQDDPRWRFVEEIDRPSQWDDNSFQRHDEGPCAAYLYHMIDILMQRIITFQRYGSVQNCGLMLDEHFQSDFKNHFNSYHVRNDMQRSIWRYKKEREAKDAAREHDHEAIADVAVGVVDEPLDVFVLETPYGGEGSGTGCGSSTASMGSDDVVGTDLSSLERADSPVEEDLGGFWFDGQDKVLRIRYHASRPHITAAIENE